MNRLQTGIDALVFIKNIPDDIWDNEITVVWDAPYGNVGSMYDMGNVNMNKTYQNKDNVRVYNLSQNMKLNESKLIMDKEQRMEIYNYIASKGNFNYIHFFGNLKGKQELDFPCQKELIWFKSNIKHTNYFSIGNHEYFYLRTPKKMIGKNRHVKYIWSVPTDSGHRRWTTTDESGVTKKRGNFTWTMRMCQKPKLLFHDLFKLLDSKFVLDPFAGFGNSINACNDLGIPIYACDIDDTLKWGK